MNLDQILAILTGRKVYNESTNTWHVYDDNGNEIVNASGVLLQGLHGFLLRQYSEVGAGKNKRSRVIIGDKEYFLTPFETADLLIQRAKQRKEKVSVKQDNIVVIPEKRDKILSSKPVTIESSHFDLHAQISANYAFIDRLRKEFQRLEQIEIARLLEEDDEECLMLLL